MRKSVLLFFVLLFMAVPVMAVSTVTITCTATKVGDVNWVTVSYSSDINRVRAFGLDITTPRNLGPADGNIKEVVVLDPCGSKYRIYPGQISFITGDINSTGYGAPYATADLNDANLAIEMGSLYTLDANYASDPNAGYNKIPGKSGDLLKFRVDGNTCSYRVDANILRGGVVMEDPYETPITNLPRDGNVCVEVTCTVPDTNGMTQTGACNAIVANNLTCGSVTSECNSTVANGLVLRSNPAGNTQVTCQSSVNLVLSLNPPQPVAAIAVAPIAGANCVAQAAILSWTVGADTNKQDIYFGVTNPPPLVASNVSNSTTTYDPTPDMNVYTLYYWRINEKNVCGGTTTGTVWCFTTGPIASVAARCCSNDAVTKCLGNINYATNTRVDNTDIGLLTTFVSGQPSNRCTTVAGSTTCPPCFDINGSGRVDNTDIGLLVTKVSGFASNRHTCPYPSCSNPP